MLKNFENPLFYYIYHLDSKGIMSTMDIHPEFLLTKDSFGDIPLHYAIKLSQQDNLDQKRYSSFQRIADVLYKKMQSLGQNPEHFCNKNNQKIAIARKENLNTDSLSHVFTKISSNPLNVGKAFDENYDTILTPRKNLYEDTPNYSYSTPIFLNDQNIQRNNFTVNNSNIDISKLDPTNMGHFLYGRNT